MYGTPHGEELAVVPWPLLIRERIHRRARSSDRYHWLVLAVVLAGLLSSNVLITVFVVALPSVASGLHTSVATITWVVTAPMLAVAVAVPLAGKLSDRWGHRRLYLVGMIGNVAVAVMSALAPDAGALIAARALGGLVGAGLGASSMALVLSMFESGDRVKAMGWWSMVGAGGPVLGVAIGGFIIQSIGWRAMFLLEMVLGAIALVLALAVLPEHGAGQQRTEGHGPPLDTLGAVLVVATVGSLLFALNRAPVVGFSGGLVIGAFCLSAVAGMVLVMVERRAEDPLVPFRYLKKEELRPAARCAGVRQISRTWEASSSRRCMLEQVYRYGESTSGLLVIARPLSFAFFAPVGGIRGGEGGGAADRRARYLRGRGVDGVRTRSLHPQAASHWSRSRSFSPGSAWVWPLRRSRRASRTSSTRTPSALRARCSSWWSRSRPSQASRSSRRCRSRCSQGPRRTSRFLPRRVLRRGIGRPRGCPLRGRPALDGPNDLAQSPAR